MTKKLVSQMSAVAFGLSCLCIAKVSAESPAFGGFGAKNEEPLQMVIDYGVGQPKHRESRHGLMEPVGLAVGQPVSIILQFPRKKAGDTITISSLDGGQLDPHGPVPIAADGTVVFHFQTDSTPGLYRLLIGATQQYQLSLYAVDPTRPARRSRNLTGH